MIPAIGSRLLIRIRPAGPDAGFRSDFRYSTDHNSEKEGMKTMNKFMITGLAAFSAVSLLCGFDSAETADSILEKVTAAYESTEDFSAEIEFNLDSSLEVTDSKASSAITMTIDGDISAAYTMDPHAVQAGGTITLNTLGLGQDMEGQLYAVPDEDGSFDVYAFTKQTEDDPGTWIFAETGTLDFDEFRDLSRAVSIGDFSGWNLPELSFTLAEKPAEIDGIECYELTTELDSANEVFLKLFETADDAVSENSKKLLDLLLDNLTGLKMKITYYISTSDYLPISVHIDMSDSDLTTLSDLLVKNFESYLKGADVTLVPKELTIDVKMSYEDVPEITIPQEALDAVASGDAENVKDVMNGLEDLSAQTSEE